MAFTFLETRHHEDYWGLPNFQNINLSGSLRYKGKTRLDGVASTILKDDFTSAYQNEFERHQKCIRVGNIFIEKSLKIIFFLSGFSVFPEEFAFYLGYTS